jgi:hypothetical protein
MLTANALDLVIRIEGMSERAQMLAPGRRPRCERLIRPERHAPFAAVVAPYFLPIDIEGLALKSSRLADNSRQGVGGERKVGGERLMTMKRTLLVAATALALSAPAVPHAHAAELTVGAPAQVIDIHRHTIVMNGSADDARFEYARIICRARFGLEAGLAPGSVLPHGYVACLKSQGFVWIPDSSAQIAARNKAAEDARWRAAGQAFGQVLIDAGQSMNQRHNCNGFIGGGGGFSMNCN